MPSFALTGDEEALVTHVRGMVATAVLGVQAKVPDVGEVHDGGHTAGMTAGRVEVLNWMMRELNARLAILGPYDDNRTINDMIVAVGDKLREVQG